MHMIIWYIVRERRTAGNEDPWKTNIIDTYIIPFLYILYVIIHACLNSNNYLS